jgi:hypothetical protein
MTYLLLPILYLRLYVLMAVDYIADRNRILLQWGIDAGVFEQKLLWSMRAATRLRFLEVVVGRCRWMRGH